MRIILGGALLLLLPALATAQTRPNVVRTAGTDEASGLNYVLVSLDGHASPASDGEPPVLTAQCSDHDGKLRFEVFATFGGVPAAETHRFHGEWRFDPTHPEYQVKPVLVRANLTLEFLGYVKQKPMKTEWEQMRQPAGELRFVPPGLHSHNLSDFTTQFYLGYLLALPTLRLSLPGQPVAEFATAGWVAQLRKESLCKASGL